MGWRRLRLLYSSRQLTEAPTKLTCFCGFAKCFAGDDFNMEVRARVSGFALYKAHSLGSPGQPEDSLYEG